MGEPREIVFFVSIFEQKGVWKMSFCTWKLHFLGLRVSFQGCSGWWEIYKVGLNFPFGTNQLPYFVSDWNPNKARYTRKTSHPYFMEVDLTIFDQIHGKRTCEVDFRVRSLEIWGQTFETWGFLLGFPQSFWVLYFWVHRILGRKAHLWRVKAVLCLPVMILTEISYGSCCFKTVSLFMFILI
jgi:hypothetical protein